MKSALVTNKLCVKKSTIHGYGVFAAQDIKEDEIVEECHALIFKEDLHHIKLLQDYVFAVGDKSVLLLGSGSIFNHSDQPNVKYVWDEDKNLMVFKAGKSIKAKEELYISYGASYFTTRELTPLQIKGVPLWRQWLPTGMLILRFSVVVSFLSGFLALLTAFQH